MRGRPRADKRRLTRRPAPVRLGARAPLLHTVASVALGRALDGMIGGGLITLERARAMLYRLAPEDR